MTDAQKRSPRPPRRLGEAGRSLWKGVVSAYDLRPDELVILGNAADCADLVASLAAALKDQPLVVRGSQGQEREHPLLSEQRQQRALLGRLLAQLKLPDLDAGVLAARNQARSAAARRAVNVRWGENA